MDGQFEYSVSPSPVVPSISHHFPCGYILHFNWPVFCWPPTQLFDLKCPLFCFYSFAKSCPTLWDHTDYSPPDSSVHGILQRRILEWVAIAFSRGPSKPRDWTRVSCIAGRFFTIWATREAKVEIFLEFPWFLYDPVNVGNLIFGPLPLRNPTCTSGSSQFTDC